MAIRTELERAISVDGQDGRLFASCGVSDDYLELTLPEAVGLESPLLSGLRALCHAPDGRIGVQLCDGTPALVCVTVLYVNAPEQRTRPPIVRVADILSELARVAPAFDFGDLLPEEVRRPRLSRAQHVAVPSLEPEREAVTPSTSLSVVERVQRPVGPVGGTSPLEDTVQAQPSAAGMEKANALAARGQLHKALRAVDDVLRLAPDLFEARQLLEWLKLLEQREKKRRREPRNPQAQLEAGFSYLQLEAYHDAADALRSACQLGPNLYLAHLLCGIALHRLGEVREARSAYFRAARLRPGDDIHDDLLSALEKGQPPMPLVEGSISAPVGLTRADHPRLAVAS